MAVLILAFVALFQDLEGGEVDPEQQQQRCVGIVHGEQRGVERAGHPSIRSPIPIPSSRASGPMDHRPQGGLAPVRPAGMAERHSEMRNHA